MTIEPHALARVGCKALCVFQHSGPELGPNLASVEVEVHNVFLAEKRGLYGGAATPRTRMIGTCGIQHGHVGDCTDLNPLRSLIMPAGYTSLATAGRETDRRGGKEHPCG